MKTGKNPWEKFELGVVTIELDSAFAVKASEGDHLFDSVFVTDANGLPTIPGESLAGVLRHALAGDQDPDTDPTCREVFGHQDRESGAASRVRLSFGHIHDSKNTPVPCRSTEVNDPMLAFVQSGVGRDHVRIGAHGAADGRGKFDQRIVPAGVRFSFEICVSSESPKRLPELVAFLNRTEVRVGGKTRAGLGSFRVIKLRMANFDTQRKEDLQRLGKVPVALTELYRCSELKDAAVPKPTSAAEWRHAVIRLSPVGNWLIGGGLPVSKTDDQDGNPWDKTPVRERRVSWQQDQGRVRELGQAEFLVPATSIKGSIRHRAAFHLRRLAGEWLTEGWEERQDCPVAGLFGEVRGGENGTPGRVYFSDTYLSEKTPLQPIQHVSLDRFTQGPMDHLLFDELSVGECQLEIRLSVKLLKDEDITVLRALQAALDDLCKGRASLGSGRGLGRFKGTCQWQENKSLIQEAAYA